VSISINQTRRSSLKQLLLSNPLLVSVMGIALLCIAGGILLTLPVSNTANNITPPLIAFFTATSAVSTTGLTLVTTATYWTPFGQAIICALIFLGGLGLVVSVMFTFWIMGNNLTLPDRLLVRTAIATEQLGDLSRLLRNIVLLDIIITITGALLLIIPFCHYADQTITLWQSLFHSVSAFNTAGFDIVGPTGLIPFHNNIILLTILTVEAVLGAISFSVLMESSKIIHFNHLSLNTKLVLVTSVIVYILATLSILINESYIGTTFSNLSIGDKIFTSLYNGISASTTTGFSTIDFSQVTIQTLIVTSVIMFIGGATGSTAGGIKINTFAVLVITFYSTLKGKNDVEIFGRKIDSIQIKQALAVFLISLTVTVCGMMLIMASNPDIPFEQILFEVISAFGTVGLSSGALVNFSTFSQIVITVLMFIGRVTPISIIMVLSHPKKNPLYRYPKEYIRLG